MIGENPFSSDWLRQERDDGRRPQGGVSYVSGATGESLRFMTLPALLEQAVSRFGGGEAAIFAAGGNAAGGNAKKIWQEIREKLVALHGLPNATRAPGEPEGTASLYANWGFKNETEIVLSLADPDVPDPVFTWLYMAPERLSSGR